MHIGLIGGIGPAATIAYYDRLVREFRRAKLPLELTIVHADVGDLIANSSSDHRGVQAQIFAKHLRQLKGAGCDVATITALTGHFCFAETEQLSVLPLVSAVEPIDRYCIGHGIEVIGLLGSPTVLKTYLFGQLQQTRSVIPQTDTEGLGKAYLEMASSGVCSNTSREMFFAAGSEMVTDQGADAVLLAGTDLGLAFDGQDPGYRVVDALKIHVDALVALARG
jgi:aspartate racemase